MSTPIGVAFLGFGNAERGRLVALLKVDPDQGPWYRHVLDIDEARFIVADGDQPGVSDLLDTLGRAGDAIVVGAQQPMRAAAWMPRPIEPLQVLQELDRLAASRGGRGQDAGAPPRLPPEENRAARDKPGRAAPEPRRPAGGSAGGTVGPDGAAGRRADDAARRLRREAALRPVSVRHALLVDDSEVALAFLERHLQRCAITADRATTSGQALQLLAQRVYGIVFLDIDLGAHSELDGLALCQTIKRGHTGPDGAAPVVALVSAFADPVDRVRGRLAGADGYIGKPLDAAELDRLLLAHGLVEPAERPRSR